MGLFLFSFQGLSIMLQKEVKNFPAFHLLQGYGIGQGRQRGGSAGRGGGKRPACPFLRGARGAKVPIQCKSIIDFSNIIVPFEMRTGGDIAKSCFIKTLFTLVEKLLLHFKPISRAWTQEIF